MQHPSARPLARSTPLALLCGALAAAPAREARAQSAPDRPFVALLTFSPGTHPFSIFGHTALWVHDPRQASPDDVDVVYNYGTFAFGSPWVIPQFLAGRLWYWLSVSTLDWTRDAYRAEGRGVRAQTLRLSDPARDQLLTRLSYQAQPERRSYRYDFFRDNCATRPRDQLDLATGGRLRAATPGPAALGLREQARRLAWASPATLAGVDLLLGPAADAPSSAWDELFLPEKLAERLRLVTVPTAEGELPLVEREFDLVAPTRPGPPPGPVPVRGAAALLGLGSFGLSMALARGRGALLGLWVAVAGGLGGLSGALMLWFWVASDVEVVWRNGNLLACAPLALGLPWLARRIARGEPRALARGARLSGLLAAGSLAGWVAWLWPGWPQRNEAALLALTPLWSGLALALWRRQRGAALPEAEAAGAPEGGAGGMRSRAGGPP